MHNIFYDPKSLESLKSFIDSYKNSFIKLIKDSWLDVEDQLIKNYIIIWNNLYKNIVDKIESSLKEDIILWRSKDENNENYIIVKVNNFRLFVYYSDNTRLKTRYIENIEFFKK